MKIGRKGEADATLRKGIKRVYDKCLAKAKKVKFDKKKISAKIRKARGIVERLHNIPRCEALVNNLCNFCDMISDYLDGTYKNLPLATFIALIGGLLYVVLPFDFFADFIPILGWVDDAAVLGFIVATEKNDVSEYLKWKKAHAAKGKPAKESD